MNAGVEYIFCIIQVRMAEEITEQLNIVFDGIAAKAPIATTVSQLISAGAPLAAVAAVVADMSLRGQPHELTAELRTAVAAVETAIRDSDDEYARLVGMVMSFMLAPDHLEATIAERSRLRAGFVCLLWSDSPERRRLLAASDSEFVAAVHARWDCRLAGSNWPDPSDRMWCCLRLEPVHNAVRYVPDAVLTQYAPDVVMAAMVAMVRRAIVRAHLSLYHIPSMPVAAIARALADHLRPVLVLPPVII